MSLISKRLIISVGTILFAACAPQDDDKSAQSESEPVTQETTDTTDTTDPYLWLEEVEGDDALKKVRSWNERTLSALRSDARYDNFLSDAKTILTSDDRIPAPGLRAGVVYNFWQDATHVRGLWRKMPLADYLEGGVNGDKPWETILDLDALAAVEDENWVYKGVDCLGPDYARCMITLSRGGSDASVRREFDIATKSFVTDGFSLPEAKGGTTWLDKDTLLFGFASEGQETESGYPITTKIWQRGTAFEDAKTLYTGDVKDVGVWPIAGDYQGKTWAGVQRAITFYEKEFFLLGSDGEMTQMPLPRLLNLEGMTAGKFIFELREDWQSEDGKFYKIGSIIAMDPDDFSTSLIFAPNKRQAADQIVTSENEIAIGLLDNIVGKVIKLTPDGDVWRARDVTLPNEGVVSLGGTDPKTGEMFVYFENPSTPETLYFAGRKGAPKALKSTPRFFDAQGVVTQQFEVTSGDGIKIPYFVIAKEETLKAGAAPTIQYGYGGFQISILPNYSGTMGKMWLENGGVYVIANIRGGGEFGPSWHQSVLKENRQKTYDDFFAISEDLISKGITTPDQLGILGGSNGGLLMGVAMTQRPDLYNAIGIGVPLLDMLRYHKLLAGASWTGEYGDPDIPEERAVIEKYSPYQNLRKDGDYPKVYFFTSTKDDRVHPGHARKMAAKMEGFGQDFLYYENIEGGHSASANKDQMAKRLALQYVYFMQQLADEK